MRLCASPGCPAVVPRGRCPAHAVEQDRARPGAATWRKWYHTKRWARLRIVVLVKAAYQCALCGAVTLRLEVDHVTKHNGDRKVFWNQSNLQALCVACHTLKTMRGE